MAQVQSIQDGAAPKQVFMSERWKARAARRLATEIRREVIVPELGECWLWQGQLHENGYGMIGRVRAHRVAYILACGDTNLFVLHKCDQRACVRPGDLFAGTKHDNMRDCAAKGRTVYQRNPDKARRGSRHPSKLKPGYVLRGDQCPRAKLTNEQAAEIRRRYAAGGVTQTQLGEEYGVRQTCVSGIVCGKIYREAGPRNEEVDFHGG